MMASTIVSAPNYARRIKWLGFAIGFFVIAYTAAWFFAANDAEKWVDIEIANINAGDTKITCDNRQVRGYPFRFGLFCDGETFIDVTKGISISSGALRTAAQVYNLSHAIAELDGPAKVVIPGVSAITVNWSLLHSSIRLDQPVPERVSIEANDLDVAINKTDTESQQALTASYAAGHMRTEDKDVSFAGEVDGMVIDPAITPNRAIPEFAASYDVLLKDGVAIAAANPGDIKAALHGQSGELRSVALIFKDGGAVSVTGPLKLSAQGLLDGDIKLTFTDAAKLGVALGQAIPEAAKIITNTLTAASLGAGADKEASLSLTIRSGKVSAGFFPIATIPPL
jgi:hypothetical protein